MQGRLKQVIQYDGEHFVLRRVASESNERGMQDLLCCLDFLQISPLSLSVCTRIRLSKV